MAFSGALPPHRLHSSRPISQAEALGFLSTYLENAMTDPAFQPNALLTTSGPVSASHGGSSSLILHNLRRVEAGLKGEHLGADFAFEDEIAEEELQKPQDQSNGDGSKDEEANGQPSGVDAEWQDKETFERQQKIEVGDIRNRGGAMAEHAVDKENDPTLTTDDKEIRKQKKKERRKAEKRDRVKKVKGP